MIQLLKIKGELLRRRFKIYGFFNITSLTAVLLGVIAAEKAALMGAGHYSQLGFWAALFYFALFSAAVTKEYPPDLRDGIFFTGADRESVFLFERYYRFWLYEGAFCLLLFPVRPSYWKACLAFFAILQILTGLLFWLKRRLNGERFAIVQGSLAIWISLAGVLAAKAPGLVPDLLVWPVKKLIPLYLAGGLCLGYCIRIIAINEGAGGGKQYCFAAATQKIFFLCRDQGLLFLVRGLRLADAALLILLTGAEIPSYLGKEKEILYAYGLSFAAAQVYLFLELLRVQQRTQLFMLYTERVRRRAAVSALKTAPLLLCAALLGNLCRVSIALILRAGILGTGTAFLTNMFLPCFGRKPDGKREWVTGRLTAVFYASGMLVALLALQF